MHFCKQCDNMYYLKLGGENQNNIIYYCRNCGYEDTTLSSSNICVSETTLRNSAQTYAHNVNAYTKSDPTLPRTNTVKCPNIECESNKDASKREIIYLRYNDSEMKYLYICTACNTSWKTNDIVGI